MRRLMALPPSSRSRFVAVAGPASAQTSERPTIVGTAAEAGQFTTLIKLARASGLAGPLWGPGSFTVFAPTDAAFAKVPHATLGALMADKAKLRAVPLYHVGRLRAGRA